MQGLQRLGIAVGAPLLLAGLIGGAVAFASESGGNSNDPARERPLAQEAPGDGAAPDHDGKDGCPGKDGEGASTSANEV